MLFIGLYFKMPRMDIQRTQLQRPIQQAIPPRMRRRCQLQSSTRLGLRLDEADGGGVVTFNAEAMIWTPWGYDDILVHNHPSCIARKSLHHYRSRWDGVCGGGSYFFSPHR